MTKYTQLGGLFWKSEKAVFCEGRPLKLDPQHTKVFFDAWACDGRRVYFHVFHRRMIDASTFTALNGWYCKDANRCYCGFKTAIKNSDPKTFEVLDSGQEKLMLGICTNHDAGFAKDATQVFFDGFLVRDADPMTFVSLGNCYGRDQKSVFYERFRLQGADPIRWRSLGGIYSRDDKRVFYQNRHVKNARVVHFQQIEPFDYNFAFDGQTFYSAGEPCSAEYYVSFLRTGLKWRAEFADLVESGRWQRTVAKWERAYRQPDEVLSYFDRLELGTEFATIEATLGKSTEIEPPDWEFYFPKLENLCRDGLLQARGTMSWVGEETAIPPNCRVYRWNHPEQVLACSFVDQKVIAVVTLDAEYANPPIANQKAEAY